MKGGGRGRRAKGFVEAKLSFTEGPKGCIRRRGICREEELASQLKGEGGKGRRRV